MCVCVRVCVCVRCVYICVFVCVRACVCVGVLVICVLVFTAFCTVCTVVFVLFHLRTFIPICYWCKDYCHRVTTQLQ